jgi:hypothetical protein
VAVNPVIRFYRRLLKYAMLAMGLLFINSIWPQLPRVPLSTLDSFLVLRCTFALYVYCWFWGCNRDLDVQDEILVKAPSPTVPSIGVAIMMFILFAFLFLVHNPLVLSALLLVFLLANIGGWIYLKEHVRPFADLTRTTYSDNGDLINLLKTRVYYDYLFGTWQWWRFAAGIAMILALVIVATGRVQIPLTISPSMLFSLLVLATVLVLEFWIGVKRLELNTLWTGLDWIGSNGYGIVDSRKPSGRVP